MGIACFRSSYDLALFIKIEPLCVSSKVSDQFSRTETQNLAYNQRTPDALRALLFLLRDIFQVSASRRTRLTYQRIRETFEIRMGYSR